MFGLFGMGMREYSRRFVANPSPPSEWGKLGVFNVITGHGEGGDELSGHPLVDMITFTGATATGRRREDDGGTGPIDQFCTSLPLPGLCP